MWVELTDGRTLGVALAWFPRLLRAAPAERARVEPVGGLATRNPPFSIRLR